MCKDFKFINKKKIIKKYYLEDLVNLNNRNNPKSYELNESIINLRKSFSKFFFIKNWEKVLFFPNNFYVKKTILNSLALNEEWIVYSDEKKYFTKDINFLKTDFEIFENFKEIKNSKKNILFWITKIKKFSNLKKNIKKWKNNKNLKIFLSIEEILKKSEWKEVTKYIDFFLFNPSKIWNLYGISILALNENTNLKPLYLGSNSLNTLSKNNFSLKKNYEAFECGTQNFVLLLILEKFFESLIKKE